MDNLERDSFGCRFYRTSFQTTDNFNLSYIYCDDRNVDKCGCYDRDCRPIVVLIHDVGYNASYWLCLMKKLCAVANVFAIDLPGAGSSDATVAANLTLAKLSQYVAELLNQVCANEVYIVGHGYGALVALNFSVLYPSRTIKVVAASANPRPYPLPGSTWTFFMTPEAQLLNTSFITPGSNTQQIACAMTQLFDPIDCEAKEFLKNQYINALGQYTLYNSTLLTVDFRATSALVSVPVLFVNGNNDPLVPSGAIDFLTGQVTNSLETDFYLQGHNYPVLNTGLFNAVVFNFLFVKCDPCCSFLELIEAPAPAPRCCKTIPPCQPRPPVRDECDSYRHAEPTPRSKLVIPCRYIN